MELSTIGILGLIYFMLYCSFFWLIVYADKRKYLNSDPTAKRKPLVSIIIPVYKNDTKQAIKKAIISALALDYPKKEIVIAWNGPETDSTKICKEFANKGLVKFIKTPKQGKAAGMNEALKHIKGELFCCLDADSFFHRGALKYMIGYFEDPSIGAVTSSMKVYKPKTLLQKIQWVEYIFAIYLRKLSSLLDCLYVVPGPGSMYRTELIRKLGGFDENNLTEDMEIAFRIQDAGYKIKNSLNAFVDTIAPKNFKQLIHQRIRWYAGFCDNIKKYKHIMLNPKTGMLGMFILPLSIVWVAIMIYSFGIVIKSLVSGILINVKLLSIVGFDFEVLLNSFFKSISFQPTFITWFSIVLTIIGLVVIYLGLKMSKENVDIGYKYPYYVSYLFLYSILMGVFWIFALSYLFTRKKTNRMW